MEVYGGQMILAFELITAITGAYNIVMESWK